MPFVPEGNTGNLLVRGEPGYYNATVTVTVGGVYIGGGTAGYTGGTAYSFGAKLREGDFTRPRQDTTDGPFRTGVGGPISRKMNLTIYYKGANYPPDFEDFEVALFNIVFGGGLVRQGVILIESFKQTGDIDRALEYTVTGETDGLFI